MTLPGRITGDGFIAVPFFDLSPAQHERILAMRNHPDVRGWMYHPEPITMEEHRGFVAAMPNRTDRRYWAVLDPGMQRIRGVVNLIRVDAAMGSAYLGIYANPLESAKGDGAACMACLKQLAFAELALVTLKLEVFAENRRAVSFYEKHGFAREGLLRKFARRNGEPADVVVMGILAEDA